MKYAKHFPNTFGEGRSDGGGGGADKRETFSVFRGTRIEDIHLTDLFFLGMISPKTQKN